MSGQPLFSNRQLFRLLWPLVAEQLLTVFVGMVDVLMVSFVGEAAMSGVSLVDSVNILIIQMLLGLTAGGTVICARYIGNRENTQAGLTGAQLLILSVLFSAVVTTLLLVLGNPLLKAIFGKVEQDVMENAEIYLRITALSFPLLAVYHSGTAIFRAAGITRISLVGSLIMNGVNVVGNAICVFGLKMGVSGVAIPTVIARGVAAVMLLSFWQKNESFRIRSVAHLKPDPEKIRSICRIGIPSGMESGIFQFGKLMLQSLVSSMGTVSIAAYAVASNLVTYLYLPGNALGVGMMTVVGQCLGAGEKKQARNYVRKLMILNYLMLAVICTLMIVFRRQVTGWYHLTGESAVLAQGLLLSHSIAMIIWPIAFLYPNYFRASGHAGFTMAVSVLSMWIFRVGLANVFVRGLHKNVLWIWYAMFIDWVFRILLFWWKDRQIRQE